MAYLYSADSIVKSYGSTPVLKAASIWAEAGRITAILGRNGCGKTTLMKVGAGVLRGDAGTVRLDGKIHWRPSLSVLARSGLFFLPARGLLSPRIQVGEQLQATAWSWRASERLAEVVERLALGAHLSALPHELSGGEQRKMELAAAMVRMPRCLLADEPFAGISPRDAEVVAEVLRELAGAGCAIVATGHEVGHLFDLADEIVWMSAGTTRSLGSPLSAARHDQFRREYLGLHDPAVGRPGLTARD